MYVFFSQVGGPGGPAAGEPPYAQPNKMSRHHMAAKTAANTTAQLPGAAPSVPYNSQQAPAAFPQPQQNHEQLETMLGNLNTDMTRQGIMTIPKGHCAACRKPIVGQVGNSLVWLWFWLTMLYKSSFFLAESRIHTLRHQLSAFLLWRHFFFRHLYD